MGRAKIAYDFCPLPRRWYAGWAHHQKFFSRGLRDALFELGDGGPILVHGSDWMSSVCKQLCIDGKDRPNVRRALKTFEAEGLICFDGTHVHGRYLPGSAPLAGRVAGESPTSQNEVANESKRGRQRVNLMQISTLPLELSDRNDSGHVLQTRQTDKKEESVSAGARTHAHTREARPFGSERPPLPEPPPELPPAEPPLPELIVSAHARRYVELRAGETCRRDYTSASKLAQWCEANAAVRRQTPAELALRVVAGLFASERAGARRWPLSWAATDPAEFLPPPAGVRPVICADAREQRDRLTAARERLQAAQRAVNNLDNAPWFDKEDALYPKMVESANADLVKAREALAALQAPVQAVAS